MGGGSVSRPKLSLKKGDAFSVARDKMTDRDIFDSYFKKQV